MALLALGINHKTASVDVRERVAFAPEKLGKALRGAVAEAGVDEVAILSTCNRTEIYCAAANPDPDRVLAWLGNYHRIPLPQLSPCSYVHRDEDAARHMMRVACGLDSLVLGEPQILGQLKSAYAIAQNNRVLHSELGRLFQHTFNVAKTVRTQTAIGENPVSVAYAAVSLAAHIFADLSRSSALLIGAGETIELVARHLRRAGIHRMIIANRTLERGEGLAREVGAEAVLLNDIPAVLADADIVISSTASPLPILGKGMVEQALKKRRHRPMFMVDIAVPRDIEAQVGDLADVYLYTVDDLHEVIEENVKSRESAAREAEALIRKGASDFMHQLRTLDAVDTLRALRGQFDAVREQELARARRMLAAGKPADAVLEQLSRSLINKLLHQPTVRLKEASAQGRGELLELAGELFNLPKRQSDERNS